MDIRSPLLKNIAAMLAGILFINPVVSLGANLAIDAAAGGNANLSQAGNGVPVVNIATPNSKGLSHNRFTDYNVDRQGLILNNAKQATQSTQLGGIILGNANLKNGAAGLILNEVTGSNPSQLRGYTEVAGQSARVIVANPHGISCDGCGFINTPRVTLTTGKPLIEQGELKRFDVDQGEILIHGAGLNASNIDQFDLIARSARINAELHANELNIVAGRNQVDANTLQATAKPDDGKNKPLLAIDSSALGGMYAGAIRLVGTEQGVGVRLAGDMAASARDIQIDASGKLTLGNTVARGQITARAGELEAQGQLYAGSRLELAAVGDLSNHHTLAAGDAVVLSSGGQIDNLGHVEAGVNIGNSRNTKGDLQLTSNNLRNSGSLLASRDLQAKVSGMLDNRDGLLVANGQLELGLDSIKNRGGTISTRAGIRIDADIIDNSGGELLAQNLALNARQVLNRDQGLIQASGAAQVSGEVLDNSGGILASDTSLSLNLNDGELNNDAGLIHTPGSLLLDNLGSVSNRGGEVSSTQGFSLATDSLDNDGGRLLTEQSLALYIKGLFSNLTGLVSAGALELDIAHLNNTDGRVVSGNNLHARVGVMEQTGGELLAEGDLELRGGQLDNRDGLLAANGQLTLLLDDIDNRGGEISSRTSASIASRTFDNSDVGRLLAAQLNLQIQHMLNRNRGLIYGWDDTRLQGIQLDNSGGTLASNTNLLLMLDTEVNNVEGLLSSEGTLSLTAGSLDNRQGSLSSADTQQVEIGGVLNNQDGQLVSNSHLLLRSAELNNSAQGLIQAGAGLLLNSGELDNRGGYLLAGQALDLRLDGVLDNRNAGLINSQGRLDLTAARLDSSAGGEVSANGDMYLRLDELVQRQGSLIGAAALSLNLNRGDLDNQGGLIASHGPLSLNNLRTLANQGGEISSQNLLTLSAAHLDNSTGVIVSRDWLRLTLGNTDNRGGLLSGWQGLAVAADNLDNRDTGTLSSHNGDLEIQLTGDLLNSQQGALVAAGYLNLAAAKLDNSEQGIISSGAGQRLELSAVLNNQGGQIDSSQSLSINAQHLDNSRGLLFAEQSLDITGTTLDNSIGRISAAAAAQLQLAGDLVNRDGQLVSDGPLQLDAAAVDNRGGILASQAAANLNFASLDNSGQGILSANGTLDLRVAGAINNRNDALIYSRDADLRLVAGSLDNRDGALQSQDDLTLEIDTDLHNQTGQLLSQAGDIRVSAANLDNRGGVLASLTGWVRTQLTGWLRNDDSGGQGGLIQSQQLDLQAAGDFFNSTGRISAQAGEARLSGVNFDNQNGLLHASGDLHINGNHFDNRGGQVGAGNIDFSLATALNNQQGILESSGALNITAASLNNHAGQLRALGAEGETSLRIAGLLDNSEGVLESASHDLHLAIGGLTNHGGSLLHGGTGEFRVALEQLNGAGGRIATGGGLTLNADNWHNSSVLQAGRLTLNIGSFTQAASGQLLASESIIGRGNDWINHGLIASDGRLDLSLHGGYSGNGQLISLGDLTLSAADLELSERAGISVGGDADFRLGKKLLSQGRITAVGDMQINAVALNNYGTLGAAQQLTLTANSLLNEQGLIFSGGDMALYLDSLTNRYADIYSLGDIRLSGDADGTWASRVDNLSGTLEAAGDFSLASAIVNNSRDVLVVEDLGKVSAVITELPCRGPYNPSGDCDHGSNDRRNAVWQVNERDKLEVTESSATSSLLAGGDIQLTGQQLLNHSSLISAAGSIGAVFTEIDNTGVKPGEIETQRIFVSGRKPDYSTYARAANSFNRKHSPAARRETLEADLNHFVSLMEREYLPGRQINEISSDGETYSAIIQAGGNIYLEANQQLENSVIRPYYSYVSGGNRVADSSPGTALASHITLSAQLPADLAQQQVNPLTLPGFSLPSGQNGLFRLNTQTGHGQHGSIADVTREPSKNLPEPAAEVQLGQQPAISFIAPLETTTLAVGQDEQLPVDTTGLIHTQAHKYLIETNPALTDLKQFMGSDYLLGQMGYDPDQAQKRLGDGLYEQRLVREALIARTGQRYLAGLTSDEAIFRYLMDNALASKDALNLSLGISLSAEQVAALTHDIVWLEEHEVLGEKVLVPMFYLAQAEGRLAANGALIQSRDITLVSGGELNNQGSLRAANDLTASAVNISNSGLIEASQRLQLLAEGSIRNARAGIIAGRDVSLIAGQDILNERSVTHHNSALETSRWETSFADSAARIEAGNSLSLDAGRDALNLGGALDSRGDLQISAGRDVTLTSVEERHSISRGSRYLNSQTAQLTSETLAGGRVDIQAGRDLAAIASRIESGQDMQLIAGNDLTLASAANENHHYSKSKKVTSQRDLIQQQGTDVSSGGGFAAVAGNDLTLISSNLTANNEAYLIAGGKVQLLAEQDVDYSFYEKKKKGSFGRKSYRMSESDNSTAAVSSIHTGTDLLIHGAEAIVAQGVQLKAGQHLELQSGGDILLLAAENSSSQASAKSKSGLLSSKGKTSSQIQTQVVGTTAEAGSILMAAGQDLLVNAGDLRAQGDMELQAGRDIELSSSMQYSNQSQSKHSSKLSFSHRTLLTHTQKQQAAEQGSGTAVGSYLSADNLLVSSGRDSSIQGSTLISEQDMYIRAGRDLDIVSAENTSQNSTSSSSKKTGEIGSWWQPAVGQVKQKVKTQSQTRQQSGSQLASLTGNINLQAGETYQQTASGVLALEGDIHLQGKQVNIEAGYDQLSHSETRSTSRTAVGGTVSIPVVNAIQSMQHVNQARERTDDPRMQALAAATLAMQGKAAYDSAQALYNGNVGGIKISLNLSNNSSKSQNTQQGQNVSESSVIAGGDIHVQATGAEDSDLSIIGSRLSAGQDIRLQADRNILLRAAENTASQSSKDNGSGWSAGIGFGLGGSQNGFTLDLAANQFRGKSDGSDSVWSNTQIEAGRQVHLESGADTRLQGAVVKGEQVTADVGDNLVLESLQDTSTYQSKQSSSSAGVSLCIPPFCAGTSTASASQSSSKARGDYASVNQKTGIQAGNDGFQLKVKGRTDLTGAVIASSEQAAQDRLNRLETGALTVRDIENHSKYKASSAGLIASVGFGIGKDNKEAAAKTDQDKTYMPNLVGSAVSKISGSDSSVTHSGISPAEIVITDLQAQQELTGQTATALLDKLNDAVRSGDGAGGIDKNWDGKKLERVVQANAEIMMAFSQQAGHAVSAYAQNKREELLEQKHNADSTAAQEEIQGQINALNTQERVMKTVIGALAGQLDTAVAHAVLQEAADQMRQYSIESSSRFAGVIVGQDEQGNPLVLSNISGDSAGVRGDGIKLGGVRVDLDLICGANNQRCATLKDENDQDILDSRGIPVLELENGMVSYDVKKAKMPFDDFLLTKDGKKMSGLTGGVQGLEGTMAGKPYAPNSFWDYMVESFAGTHDTIGGDITGLYDEQGNTTRRLSDAQNTGYNIWSVIAIAPSAPFALSEALPSEAWQVLELLLKGQQ